MGRKRLKLAGERFGRLVAIKEGAGKWGQTTWVCLCDCGQETEVALSDLRSGNTKSCGCLAAEAVSIRATTHGLSNHPMYARWRAMINRCYNSNNERYADYGGRGIEVCKRWRDSLENFVVDMGYCPEGCSIERVDNDGDYEPGNCVWADRVEQGSNKRNNIYVEYRGQTYTLAQLALLMGLKAETLRERLARMSVEEAIMTPLQGEIL